MATLVTVVVLLLSVLATAFWMGDASTRDHAPAESSSAGTDEGAAAGATGQENMQVTPEEQQPPQERPQPDVEPDAPVEEEAKIHVPLAPEVTLTASASMVTVPDSVSFSLSIKNMDADTLAWSLDLWGDGVEDDYGAGNPKGAPIHTVHLDDLAQAGKMRAEITVQDENNAAISRSVEVAVLAPCDVPQLAVKADPFDDAVTIAEGASEITCYGATRIGDDLRLELSVIDRDDLVLEEGQHLRYYLYFTANWGGSDTYNRITIDYSGAGVTGTWDRLGPLFIYEPRTDDPQFTFAWEGDVLRATVPLDDVDRAGVLPVDADRMNVYAESWLQRPAGQSNTFLDFVASAAQGEDCHFIKFMGDDLVLETESVC